MIVHASWASYHSRNKYYSITEFFWGIRFRKGILRISMILWFNHFWSPKEECRRHFICLSMLMSIFIYVTSLSGNWICRINILLEMSKKTNYIWTGGGGGGINHRNIFKSILVKLIDMPVVVKIVLSMRSR